MPTLKIATIIGARPQFIKASAVSRAFAGSPGTTEVLIHTGQHYDSNMSAVFFQELEIPAPQYNLGIGSGSHGEQTGRQLAAIEQVLLQEKPDWVLVYGDTNSTLAGALAAAKLHIPIAHVEAGLRSFNKAMPEEINRILTDHCSDLLFAPTTTAVENLRREGIPRILEPLSAGSEDPGYKSAPLEAVGRVPSRGRLPAFRVAAETPGIQGTQVHEVGDVMYDVALHYAEQARTKSTILADLHLTPKRFILATIHRAANTDDPQCLRVILEALQTCSETMPVVFPVHPRTRHKLETISTFNFQLSNFPQLRLVDPVGYLDMVTLEKNAAVIATDSGGVQKEAFFYGVPCVTLRAETEWVELLETGWNRLCPPTSAEAIRDTILAAIGTRGNDLKPYGDGKASEKIATVLANSTNGQKAES